MTLKQRGIGILADKRRAFEQTFPDLRWICTTMSGAKRNFHFGIRFVDRVRTASRNASNVGIGGIGKVCQMLSIMCAHRSAVGMALVAISPDQAVQREQLSGRVLSSLPQPAAARSI
jgi:hypothetical protein